MSIKMRTNKSNNCVCEECGALRKNVLDMFDISIFGEVHTICDDCNDKLFYKTLKANVYTQSRLKSKEDIKVIEARNIKIMGKKDGLSVAEALRGTKGE